MRIHKKTPNSYGQEQLVTYEFIYEFIIFYEFIYEFNDFYEFIYECMYEFKYFWIQKYMNSWFHEFNGHWIHMFSEFINDILWIRCVIQTCYLLLWDAAALPTWQGSFPVLPVPRAAQHWQATFHCLEVPLWLCPQWVAFETESRKGCWLNELQLQVAKSRNRMEHFNSPSTHWHNCHNT